MIAPAHVLITLHTISLFHFDDLVRLAACVEKLSCNMISSIAIICGRLEFEATFIAFTIVKADCPSGLLSHGYKSNGTEFRQERNGRI
jgi:hypothetical protein